MDKRKLLSYGLVVLKVISTTILVLLFSLCIGGKPYGRHSQNESCKEPLPRGVKKLGRLNYRGPWVFEVGRRSNGALKGIDNSDGHLKKDKLKIRMDDGSLGTLIVEQRECQPGEDCAPFDCGCFANAGDSYWVHVKDARGRKVTDFHLWAAYGNFQIIATDLIGGRGDELLVLREPNRGSPMYRYDLKILQLGRAKPIELGSIGYVCDWLDCCCSVWRDNIYVSGSGKPRRLILRREISAAPCCPGVKRTDEVGRRRVFRFSALRRKYEGQS